MFRKVCAEVRDSRWARVWLDEGKGCHHSRGKGEGQPRNLRKRSGGHSFCTPGPRRERAHRESNPGLLSLPLLELLWVPLRARPRSQRAEQAPGVRQGGKQRKAGLE